MDVIVALYVPSALAAKQATREIPIVAIAADPVETGIVASLARPGGNITGVSLMSAASNAKNIELFRDMLPSVRRVQEWTASRCAICNEQFARDISILASSPMSRAIRVSRGSGGIRSGLPR